MANISDFNYHTDKNKDYSEIDILVLSTLNENIKKIDKAYKDFDYISIVDIINTHTLELSA
jgi:isoleucyl-tRNA synthetase